MKTIELLKIKANSNQEESNVSNILLQIAEKYQKEAEESLKRILAVLKEFDLHDASHSKKVLENQEALLGVNVNDLSSYELFLIYMAAYFHDIAMAPSDWELKLLELTEGTDRFYLNNHSLKNDLKEPLSFSSALNWIKSNTDKLYVKFENAQKWLFAHNSENVLREYLAGMLIDYQTHRNGFHNAINSANSKEEFEKISKQIRIDFIRTTHHTRIELYLKNFAHKIASEFSHLPNSEKLIHDLGKICKSHGEDISYIEEFETDAEYMGQETTNLQFVAILLRLGDIIHFSFDRAPKILSTAKVFDSGYSFFQWAIKEQGVNYSIKNGQITFKAFCKNPESFYKLHEYLDWIDVEIQNYFKLERNWDCKRISISDEVCRRNIKYDEEVFIPKKGLCFSLNQNRIIELLMGVGLYKDKFACLRELYQNSLDACKCMLAEANKQDVKKRGKIEFGLEEQDGNVYLYCLDNGIGMSKYIIETYLLNIGNSYYNSNDFFKQRALWGGDFTPTSQFGIGILSCFMIGTKIEITSKMKGKEIIACSIDGPHESFYYKKVSRLVEDKFHDSGTLIRIKIKESFNQQINNSIIDNINILSVLPMNFNLDEFKCIFENLSIWNTNLFHKIHSFIVELEDGIDVFVKQSNEESCKIISHNLSLYDPILSLNQNHNKLLSKSSYFSQDLPSGTTIKKVLEYCTPYKIEVEREGISFKTEFLLPNSNIHNDVDFIRLNRSLTYGNVLCIDGIIVNNTQHWDKFKAMEYLTSLGRLNFQGNLRPKLSVDRLSVIDVDNKIEDICNEIAKDTIKKYIITTINHIKSKLQNNSNSHNRIWKFIFSLIRPYEGYFLYELSISSYGDIKWNSLSNIIGKSITIREFMKVKTLDLIQYSFDKLDDLGSKLIINKMVNSNKIQILQNSIKITQDLEEEPRQISFKKYGLYSIYIVRADIEDETFEDFDLIKNLYPIVSESVFDLLMPSFDVSSINLNTKLISVSTNGISFFYNQNPNQIHPTLGLFHNTFSMFEKSIDIYNFGNHRSTISLFPLNFNNLLPDSKKRYVVSAFINHRELSTEEKDKLELIKAKDPLYYKGVKEGWSILITGMPEYNTIIIPGKTTRKNLVAKIPDKFWELYDDIEFYFPNGNKMAK